MVKKNVFLFGIFLVACMFFVSAENKQNLIGFGIKYSDNSFSIEDAFLDYGYASKEIADSKYILRTLDSNKNILEELYFSIESPSFSPPREWFDEEGNQIVIPDVVEEEIDKIETFYLPYSIEARYVAIYDMTNNILYEVDFYEFLNISCGDGFCDSYKENEFVCAQDCFATQEELSLNYSKVDYPGKAQMSDSGNNGSPYLKILLSVTVLFFGGIVFYFVVSKKRN
jgi:hypothetical protein